MDSAAPSAIRAVLREHGLRPRKRLGQHFLADGNVLDRLARLAVHTPDEGVLEIGAGLGSLTRRLAGLAARVLAVEVDEAFRPILARTLTDRPNADIVFGDFLELDTSDLLDRAFGSSRGVVAGNIPYNITSPILERLFDRADRIERIVFLVQAEVAARLAASPGDRDYSSLTVFAQYHAAVRTEGTVPAHLFMPPPDVGSAVVVIEPHTNPPVTVADPAQLRRVVRAAFGYRRKTIANALATGGVVAGSSHAASILIGIGIDSGRRGESLTLAEFGRLADAVTAVEAPS
ncbi:MAG: ribosomal RNA small subunit methyltransferase A [Armatimonadetes bacterium]|nr:ribosomal RNA small subunit methyltransferase A [Armatimonadota bacterium]